MRILITGGAGFIGSHLVDALLTKGHEIVVLDDLSSGKTANLPALVPPKLSLEQLDIRSAKAAALIARFRPEAVVHLAAQMDVRRSVTDPLFDADVNILGTLNIAKAALECGTQHFIFASSGGAIYGEQEVYPAPESHVQRPTSPYGVSKACGEKYLEYFSLGTPMRTVLCRFANVYGPRQDPHGEAGVVAIFCGKLLGGDTPTIFGDGEQTRDYVYVADVVRACVAALETPEARGAFNIGTGVETNVNRLAEVLARQACCAGNVVYAPARAGEQLRSVIDPTRAQEVLGWQPQVSLEQGLRSTFEWFSAKNG